MFDNWLPNWVDPVTYSTDDVIVWTIIVCAVKVPATRVPKFRAAKALKDAVK